MSDSCTECGRWVPLIDGMAQYHPYEFCRVYKAGGDPWGGRKHLNLDQMTAPMRLTLQSEIREFWRARTGTEIELPLVVEANKEGTT